MSVLGGLENKETYAHIDEYAVSVYTAGYITHVSHAALNKFGVFAKQIASILLYFQSEVTIPHISKRFSLSVANMQNLHCSKNTLHIPSESK